VDKQNLNNAVNKEHFAKFGSPELPHGALYIAKSREGLIRMFADILKDALELKGIAVTPEIERLTLELCRKKLDENDREADKRGIPEKIKVLFEISKKSEVVKYCRNIELSEDELYLLVHNSSQIGFRHRSKFAEFVPQHLKVTDSDISNLHNNKPRKLVKKAKAIFLERRRIHVHLFERGNQWHCFYDSYQDMESGSKSHWKYGSHLHYVSHLWPQLTKEGVWAAFDKRFTDISGSIHIRLIPFKYDEGPNHV
jgi:hypothetical protein